MVNEILVNLVNSVLGSGKPRSKGNQSYICPFHTQEVISEKLEINFDDSSPNYQHWACWSCPSSNKSSGKSILSLFKKKNVSSYYMEELQKIIPKGTKVSFYKESEKPIQEVHLPKEFKKFNSDPKNLTERKALHYLTQRGITQDDIDKYNIGYCEYGKYSKRIIIPSYNNEGKLNFYTGRSFEHNSYNKYLNSDTSKDIIMFELFINWNSPVILVEGCFDAIAVKRNVIPIMGKNIQNNLMKKLIQQSVKKIYVCLDNDALDYALEYCQTFMNEGKKVYLIELKDKDPSKIGFSEFTNLIHNANPLTEYSLMERKLQLI